MPILLNNLTNFISCHETLFIGMFLPDAFNIIFREIILGRLNRVRREDVGSVMHGYYFIQFFFASYIIAIPDIPRTSDRNINTEINPTSF